MIKQNKTNNTEWNKTNKHKKKSQEAHLVDTEACVRTRKSHKTFACSCTESMCERKRDRQTGRDRQIDRDFTTIFSLEGSQHKALFFNIRKNNIIVSV